MTKKNAKKIIARARTEKLGGKYQHHLRQLGGAGGVDSPEAHSTEAQKYVHVVDGTPDGTSWLLSDEPHGALLSIAVPSGPLTTQLAEEAFAQAAFPLTCETSMDLGKTWVQHSDGPQREWNAAIRLLYGRLGLGTGPWNAARIRTRTGTELVRHPPKLLSEIFEQLKLSMASADIMLAAPNDQIFVSFGSRTFSIATMMNTSEIWPVFVTPIPPTPEIGGSWECWNISAVRETLQFPGAQPGTRVVSAAEINVRIMRRDILVRSKGGVPDAYLITLRPDSVSGESLDAAIEEARREAKQRSDLLEVGIRRSDRPGHPWVCAWKRRSLSDGWKFEWGQGASDPHAEPLTLV